MNETLQAILEANRRGFRISFPPRDYDGRIYLEVSRPMLDKCWDRVLVVDISDVALLPSKLKQLLDESDAATLKFLDGLRGRIVNRNAT